jgi:hypothetical protein
MREPDLVKRADQAAAAVEQAWTRWRARHGLGSGPLPPVSSYVGYSVDEPWGQPRVIIGIAADEAERLAAILDADDYVGPVHAKLTGWSDRHLLPESAAAACPGDPLGVQAQSAGRADGGLDAAPTVALPVGALTLTASPGAGPVSSSPVDAEPSAAALTPGQPPDPEEPEAAAATDTPGQPVRPAADQDTVITDLRELVARTTGRPPMAQAFPTAVAHEAAADSAKPGDKPDQPEPTTSPGPVAVQRPAADDHAEPEPARPRTGGQAADPPGADGAPPHDLPAGTRLVSVASKNGPPKPASGHDGAPWPAAKGKRQASDTAV